MFPAPPRHVPLSPSPAAAKPGRGAACIRVCLVLLALIATVSLQAQIPAYNLTAESISILPYFSLDCEDDDYYEDECFWVAPWTTESYDVPPGYVYHGAKILCGECSLLNVVASTSCLGGSETFSCGGPTLTVRGGPNGILIE